MEYPVNCIKEGPDHVELSNLAWNNRWLVSGRIRVVAWNDPATLMVTKSQEDPAFPNWLTSGVSEAARK